jgi:hypothetical protein
VCQPSAGNRIKIMRDSKVGAGTTIETKRTVGPSVRSLSFVAAVWLSLAARDASARERFRLSWSAPAGCPTAEDVRAAALRGAEPDVPDRNAAAPAVVDEPELEASARVSSRQVGAVTQWTVELQTRRGALTGERTIEASSCAGIAEATAVVLGLALLSGSPASEPEIVASPTTAAPPATAGTTGSMGTAGDTASDGRRATTLRTLEHAADAARRTSRAASARPTVPARALGGSAGLRSVRGAARATVRGSRLAAGPPRARAVHGARLTAAALRQDPARAAEPSPAAPDRTGVDELAPSAPERAARGVTFGVSAAGDSATLPSPALGASFTLGWRSGRLGIELDVRTWVAQTHTLDFWGAGARFSRLSVGARSCWSAWRSAASAVDLAACGGADVERVNAPGRGVDPSYEASADWVALAAGGLARFVLTPWLALRTRLEGSAPLSRPDFTIRGAGPLHRPALLSAAGSLGIELSFF